MNQLEAAMDATASPLTEPFEQTSFKINYLHRKPLASPAENPVRQNKKANLSDYWKNFRHSTDSTLFGIDRFIDSFSTYKNHRIGFVTNNSATTTEGKSSRKALLQAGFKLVRVFSPEHGINTLGEDGSHQPNGKDEETGLPITSLYGDRMAPNSDDMQNIDLMVFDVPDAGTRFYTFLWTLTHVMEACAENGKPLIVLDRPNPIGGRLAMAEGPWLDETNCSSFLGRWNLPLRHSCTLGELARYFAASRLPSLDLKVMALENWNRNEMTYRPGWHFLAPSPALNSLVTAYLYPGMGLLEGLNVSEGRGTPYPFHMVAAPWLNSLPLKKHLDQQEQEGFIWQFNSMLPTSGPYAGQLLYGLQCHILDLEKFRPVQAGFQLIRALTQVFPDDCIEKPYPTLANPTGRGHLDRLTGIHNFFEKISNPRINLSTDLEGKWEETMANYLLY